MLKAKKGDWVQVENIVLEAGHRAPQVPPDTQRCDMKLWVKGEALAVGDQEIEILTNTGRRVSGKLSAVTPGYNHNYGEFQPELIEIEHQLKALLFGGDD